MQTLQKRTKVFNREDDGSTLTETSMPPTMAKLLSEKRPLTTNEQQIIIDEAENTLLFNDKLAHHAFLFLIVLEACVFFFFAISDLRLYFLRHTDDDGAGRVNLALKGGVGPAAAEDKGVDSLCEALSHVVVCCLAFAAAVRTFGKRSLKRIVIQNLIARPSHATAAASSSSSSSYYPKTTSPPMVSSAFPPPPPALPAFLSSSGGALNASSSSSTPFAVEDDEDNFSVSLSLDERSIASVQLTHRRVAILSACTATPLMLLSILLSSTNEGSFIGFQHPAKLLLLMWQPLQHFLMAWAVRSLVEDVLVSLEQLKKMRYSLQDA